MDPQPLPPSDAPRPPKPFAWSFSALMGFETCARKFYHSNIKKDFVEPDNDQRKWGFQVHEKLATRVGKGLPLPVTMADLEPWAKWALQNTQPGDQILIEQKLALTKDLQPCGYFDRVRDPWYRGVADVLKIGTRSGVGIARLIDWKTGKRKDESEQLALLAECVFAHYPAVQKILCQFVWLQDEKPTDTYRDDDITVTRGNLQDFWLMMYPRIKSMQRAAEKTDYPPKPSGLCKKHCVVTTCEYYGRGSY